MSYFEDRIGDLFVKISVQFDELRDLMATKHKDGSKWVKAVMSYKKGGAVDMDYEYPDQPPVT